MRSIIRIQSGVDLALPNSALKGEKSAQFTLSFAIFEAKYRLFLLAVLR